MERNDAEDLAAHEDIDAYLADLPWGCRTPHVFKMEVRGYVFSFAAWLQTPDGARALAMLNRKAGSGG